MTRRRCGRIIRVDQDAADPVGITEAHVTPVLTTVVGAVNPHATVSEREELFSPVPTQMVSGLFGIHRDIPHDDLG